MRNDILQNKNQIIEWIHENKSKAFIARELKCKQDTLEKYLKKMNIQYSGNKCGKGIPKPNNQYMDLSTYLKTSQDIQPSKIRIKLLREGIKPYQCECCKQTTWLGNPIPLELHHKDGDRHHNEIDNFELLCPNCHALTDTYSGKNIGRYT